MLTTPALVSAGNGEPAVDESPAEDRWGNFYSAYCPVMDSKGSIAGIVGVDFNAEWYDSQVARYTVSIAAVTFASVLSGVIVVTLISRNVRKRFRALENGLLELSDDMDLLMAEMASRSGYPAPQVPQENALVAQDADELEVISDKINSMRADLGVYMDYLHTQAYTDALTHMDNFSAYHELVDQMDEKIKEGTADFWVVVFDVNSLKQLNDNYGHECGNVYIKAAAQIIADGFADVRTFRIGGDEFAVIAEGYQRTNVDEGLQRIEQELTEFNATQKPSPANLVLSKGAAGFEAESDQRFKDVFDRADMAMYRDKREYYRTVGDRRKRRD
ncbi:MAG: GGDEF domain-containing protein [Coriobacteriales bacterium]|nr:GGDEF domain-containing protein [Coriobacteriales bacterium]